jgi:hypothetical protein
LEKVHLIAAFTRGEVIEQIPGSIHAEAGLVVITEGGTATGFGFAFKAEMVP